MSAPAGRVPELTPQLEEEALRQPGRWVYAVDPEFDGQESVPPYGIVGAWQVGEDGKVTGEFRHNPIHRPSMRSLGLPDSIEWLNLLDALRAADTAGEGGVIGPYSDLAAALAQILAQEGYLAGWSVEEEAGDKELAIRLAHGPGLTGRLASSRSERQARVHIDASMIGESFAGHGVAIVSTSSGLMTDQEAAAQSLGGEVIVYFPDGVAGTSGVPFKGLPSGAPTAVNSDAEAGRKEFPGV